MAISWFIILNRNPIIPAWQDLVPKFNIYFSWQVPLLVTFNDIIIENV